jgi:hypothetical protein
MCFKKTLCRIQDSEVQVPCIRSDDVVFCPDAHQSSNIHPDDKIFPSGLPFVSRSFELFQIASVQTSQQHVWTPFNVRQAKGFSFQTQIWKDSFNRPDAILDKARHAEDLQPSRRQSSLSRRSVLIMKITCSRSATVRTWLRKEFQRIWKASCIVGLPNAA